MRMTIAACLPTSQGAWSAAPNARGGSAGVRPAVAKVPLAVCFHAALEPVRQIDVSICVESDDDLLLSGVCHFDFALRGHAQYLCEAEF